MPTLHEAVGFFLFATGAVGLAYVLFKQKEKRFGPAVTLAAYCLAGVAIYGLPGVVPTRIKGGPEGIDVELVQRLKQTANDEVDAIKSESARQQADIKKIYSELHSEESAAQESNNKLQQSNKELKSSIEQARVMIGKLRTEQNSTRGSVTNLERRVTARHLSASDEQQLKAELCKAPHSVGFRSSFTGEEADLYGQLKRDFTECGWSIAFSDGLLINPFKGIHIVWITPVGKDAAMTLAHLLQSQDKTETHAGQVEKGADLIVIIGTKPVQQ
jgi:hypothetical protein